MTATGLADEDVSLPRAPEDCTEPQSLPSAGPSSAVRRPGRAGGIARLRRAPQAGALSASQHFQGLACMLACSGGRDCSQKSNRIAESLLCGGRCAPAPHRECFLRAVVLSGRELTSWALGRDGGDGR